MATVSITHREPQSKVRAALGFLIRGVSRDDPLALQTVLNVALLAGGVLVVSSGLIHLRLWQMAYRHIPTIGPLFVIQGLAGVAIGAAIIGFRRLHKAVIGAGYMAASLAGLLVSISGGLFNFHESLAAPYATLSLNIEIVGLVLLLGVAGILALGRRSPRRAEDLAMPETAPASAPWTVLPSPAAAHEPAHPGGSSSWRAGE